MKSIRIMVPFTPSQAQALIDLAKDECRDPREQARFIVVRELAERGMLPKDDEKLKMKSLEAAAVPAQSKEAAFA